MCAKWRVYTRAESRRRRKHYRVCLHVLFIFVSRLPFALASTSGVQLPPLSSLICARRTNTTCPLAPCLPTIYVPPLPPSSTISSCEHRAKTHPRLPRKATSYPNESNPLINPSEDTSTTTTTNRSTTCSEIPSSLLTPSGRPSTATHSQQQQRKLVKALFYAVQVFYSFFIMLLFMTYNGWIMLSVAVGAFVGYLLFSGGSVGGASAAKSAACH